MTIINQDYFHGEVKERIKFAECLTQKPLRIFDFPVSYLEIWRLK